MASPKEFLELYEQFKNAFDNTMNAVNKLKETRKLQTNSAWNVCLTMIDETFKMPLEIPTNIEDVQPHWSDLCVMVERLTIVKEEILKKMQPEVQKSKPAAGLFQKGLFSTVIFVASSAALSFLAPGPAGWLGRKLVKTSMTVGRFVAPHGLSLLHRSIQYLDPNQQNKHLIPVDSKVLESGAYIVSGALGAYKTIKTGYELLNLIQQQRAVRDESNNNA